MSAIGERLTSPMLGPYSASKCALEALTTALRLELAPWQLHVAIAEPGAIATPIWSKSVAVADRLVAQMPARVLELYGAAITRTRASASKPGKGIPTERVAAAVAHALTAAKPRRRYPVGLDARIGEVVRLLPEGAREWLLARQSV